jgi:predicted ATPase/DNA-binding CsgD family transcriptional regulator
MNIENINQVWIEPFNSRELEVLHLLSDGLSNREIAEKLYLSIDTIKWYNKQLYIKLGVSNRTQAAKKAAELKLLETNQIFSTQEKGHAAGNLPAQISSYVGRKREIGEIRELLRKNRLVTLTGVGGSGKTRLALKVAEKLQGSYPDGVWLVELAKIHEPSLVLPTIANVFNVVEKADATLGEVLKRKLSRKHLLLLIDNLEHLLDSAPLISELLAAVPQLSVLGTSRERLHIYGEQEYPVQPLNLPDPDKMLTGEELRKFESITLFIKRAGAVNPNLSLDEGALQHLARICVRLDGLPLAIELCAPMVKVFPLGVIAERIEKSLSAIPAGPRDLPARHQTLIKTLQWSSDLLTEDEKLLFERLAIFNGGGTLEAIEAICADGISKDIGNLISALVNKNLVLAIERRDGEIHFSLLETIRHYNLERLTANGEIEPLSKLHAEYFTRLAELAEDEFGTPKHKYWFLHLKFEQDNIRSAMDWILRANNSDLGVRLAVALYHYWVNYGFSREALRWNEQALEKSKSAAPVLKAIALRTIGDLCTYISEFERAKSLLNQALDIFRELKDEGNEAWALILFGYAHIMRVDDLPLGIEMSKKGIEKFKKLNDHSGMILGLNILGDLYRVYGELQTAKNCYQESLQYAQESGEKIREAIQLSNLGVVAYEEKEYLLAENLLQQALEKFLDLDATYGMSYHIGSLAGPSLGLGKNLKAARILGASAAGMDSIENPYQLAEEAIMDNISKDTLEALDKETFMKAFQEGQRMSLHEAVAYALNDSDETG